MISKFVMSASFGAAMLLAQPGAPHAGVWMGEPERGMGMMMPMGPASRTPVTGAPYSAVESVEIQQTLAGGNQIQRKTESKVYRDSQGRVRTEHTFTRPGDASARTMITIFDPVAGYVYRLDPESKTAHQMAIRTQANGPRHTPDAPPENGAANRQVEDLGTQVVNNVSATGTRTTITIPANAIGNTQPIQVVREAWISTDLKVPVLIKTSDPRFGNTTMQLTNIVQGEPDPSLFQVPSGYTTVPGRGGPGEAFGRARGGMAGGRVR
jgi:hypothetical protein